MILYPTQRILFGLDQTTIIPLYTDLFEMALNDISKKVKNVSFSDFIPIFFTRSFYLTGVTRVVNLLR